MKKLIWKLRYTWHLYARGGLPLHDGWDCAETAWADYGGDDGPIEAADEEMSCWSQ